MTGAATGPTGDLGRSQVARLVAAGQPFGLKLTIQLQRLRGVVGAEAHRAEDFLAILHTRSVAFAALATCLALHLVAAVGHKQPQHAYEVVPSSVRHVSPPHRRGSCGTPRHSPGRGRHRPTPRHRRPLVPPPTCESSGRWDRRRAPVPAGWPSSRDRDHSVCPPLKRGRVVPRGLREPFDLLSLPRLPRRYQLVHLASGEAHPLGRFPLVELDQRHVGMLDSQRVVARESSRRDLRAWTLCAQLNQAFRLVLADDACHVLASLALYGRALATHQDNYASAKYSASIARVYATYCRLLSCSACHGFCLAQVSGSFSGFRITTRLFSRPFARCTVLSVIAASSSVNSCSIS